MGSSSVTDASDGCRMPVELLEQIFSNFKLPSPAVLGRQRYEHLEREDDSTDGESTHYYPKLKTDDGEHAICLQTLSAISRCSKQFNDLATPILYHSYPGDSLVRTSPLIRTLITKPSLRKYIKAMTLGPWTSMKPYAFKHENPAADSAWWKASIQRLGISQNLLALFSRLAKKRYDDAKFALLVFLCTEIEELDLSASMDIHSSIFPTLCHELTKLRNGTSDTKVSIALPLQKLRVVNARLADTSNVAGTKMLDNLIRYPPVRSLTLYRFIIMEPKVFENAQQLEELCLWRCTWDDDAQLLDVLKLLPNLKSLSINYAGFTCSMGGIYKVKNLPLKWNELMDLLVKHTTKLEQLRLDAGEAMSFAEDATYPSEMSNLSGAVNLKELVIGLDVFVIWSKSNLSPAPCGLPASLEKLVLLMADRDCTRDEESIRSLASFLIARVQDFPGSVKTVHVELPFKNVKEAFDAVDMGWRVEEVMDDVELVRASPVVGSMTKRVERKKIEEEYLRWQEWRGRKTARLVRA